MTKPTIRLASENDSAQVAAIYAPFCESTAISFEYKPPSAAEMANRIKTIILKLPWLVLEDEGTIAGYVYASPHRERAAYAWSVDTTVYVRPDFQRCGVGRALYNTLLQLLRLQGYYNAYAGITLPNSASTGLHEALGFKRLGVYHHVGYKLNAWHDVAWYELSLNSHLTNPQLPLPVSAIAGSAEWKKAIELGSTYYRKGKY